MKIENNCDVSLTNDRAIFPNMRQFVSFRVFDGSSEMWLRSFCILRRSFSALHRSQLYRHLLRILSHFLSTQAQNIWSLSNIVKNIVCLHRNPISCDQLEKNLHPSVWEGFSLLDSTLLVKTMLALFRADEPICCGRLEKLPLTIPAVTRKNLLILCDKICATQVTGFKFRRRPPPTLHLSQADLPRFLCPLAAICSTTGGPTHPPSMHLESLITSQNTPTTT